MKSGEDYKYTLYVPFPLEQLNNWQKFGGKFDHNQSPQGKSYLWECSFVFYEGKQIISKTVFIAL